MSSPAAEGRQWSADVESERSFVETLYGRFSIAAEVKNVLLIA